MANSIQPSPILISVVDDDESVRESLPDLIGEFGFSAQAFASPEAFLKSGKIEETSCLVLDVCMPGMSGPDLKRELERLGHRIPALFITAHSEIAVRSDAVGKAVACLIKPFGDTQLHDALKRALGM